MIPFWCLHALHCSTPPLTFFACTVHVSLSLRIGSNLTSCLTVSLATTFLVTILSEPQHLHILLSWLPEATVMTASGTTRKVKRIHLFVSKEDKAKSPKETKEWIGIPRGKGRWEELGDWDWHIYTIDTTYKSEEELKNLLRKVKEESEKAGLKLNI